MANVKKLLQVTEEAAPAVQIPFVVGNELFLLTQQDVRRIEDTRYLSYTRLEANGLISNNLNSGVTGNTVLPVVLQNLIGNYQPQTQENFVMDIDRRPTIANIAKQISWAKESKATSTYPLSYSKTTSTCELQKPKHVHICQHCHTACQTNPQTKSQACNTDLPAKQNGSSLTKKSSVLKQEQSSHNSSLDFSHCESQDIIKCDASTQQQQPAKQRASFKSAAATERSQSP